jgi:hypothetical protein
MFMPTTSKNSRLAFLFFALALLATKFISQLRTIFPEQFGNFNINPWENVKDHSGHLCAEYFNLAVSLVSGYGISNPFGVETGPSAWMPPLLVWILAGLIYMFRYVHKVSFVFNMIQLFFITITGWLITRIIIREYSKNTSPISNASPVPTNLAYAIFYCLSLINFYWFYQFTHDHSLLIVLLTLNLVLLQKLIHGDSAELWSTCKLWSTWGFLVGITSLANPILAMSCVVVGSGIAITNKKLKMLALAISLAVIPTGPWFVRNYVHFGKFIPIKSNGIFEVAFGNVHSKSGVYTATEHQQHPFILGIINPDEFTNLGWTSELDIANYLNDTLKEYLLTQPTDYLKKVKNRLLAATIWYHPYFSKVPQRALLLHRILYAIPFVCWLFLLFYYRSNSSFQNTTLWLGALYLLPYVLIAFYDRYSVVLLPLQTLYIYWTIDRVVSKIRLSRQLHYQE